MGPNVWKWCKTCCSYQPAPHPIYLYSCLSSATSGVASFGSSGLSSLVFGFMHFLNGFMVVEEFCCKKNTTNSCSFWQLWVITRGELSRCWELWGFCSFVTSWGWWILWEKRKWEVLCNDIHSHSSHDDDFSSHFSHDDVDHTALLISSEGLLLSSFTP